MYRFGKICLYAEQEIDGNYIQNFNWAGSMSDFLREGFYEFEL